MLRWASFGGGKFIRQKRKRVFDDTSAESAGFYQTCRDGTGVRRPDGWPAPSRFRPGRARNQAFPRARLRGHLLRPGFRPKGHLLRLADDRENERRRASGRRLGARRPRRSVRPCFSLPFARQGRDVDLAAVRLRRSARRPGRRHSGHEKRNPSGYDLFNGRRLAHDQGPAGTSGQGSRAGTGRVRHYRRAV